jgi:hypothetical protein
VKPEELVEIEPNGPDVVTALANLRGVYEELYGSTHTAGAVAAILWDQLLKWRRGALRDPSLKRSALRAKVGFGGESVSDETVDKALSTVASNLWIFGHARAASSAAGVSKLRGPMPNPERCTFTINGSRYLVTIAGPTGNDRGDRKRNSLWLEPRFTRVPDEPYVLARLSRACPDRQRHGVQLLEVEFVSLPGEKDANELLALADAFAISVHGVAGTLGQKDPGVFESGIDLAEGVEDGNGKVVAVVGHDGSGNERVRVGVSVEADTLLRAAGRALAAAPHRFVHSITLSLRTVVALSAWDGLTSHVYARLGERDPIREISPRDGAVVETTRGLDIAVFVVGDWAHLTFSRRLPDVRLYSEMIQSDPLAFLDWLLEDVISS